MKNFISPAAKRTRQAVLLSALLAATAGAQAAGTASGVTISNTATLSYAVSNVNQADINSNTASFMVDNKVNLNLVENGSLATKVAAGALAQVTSFILTNTGNTAQGYNLSASNVSSTVFGTADSYDVSNFKIYVDANNNGVLDAAEVAAGAITNYTSLAADASVHLLVAADIPAGQANGTQAAISLTAVTTSSGTSTPVVQSASNDPAVADIVFADGSTTSTLTTGGTDPGQTARDATAVALDVYLVQTAQLTVTKTLTTVCDPINGTGTPFNIPGALVNWSVTVSNAATAGASATLAQISDALNANTTFDADFEQGSSAATCAATANVATNAINKGFRVSCSGTGNTRACVGTPRWATTTNDGDAADLNGSTVYVNFSSALPNTDAGYAAGELKPGESVNVQFQVFIN